jgi:DNA invertase Pin-like site-specific DNA recombinase
MSRSLCYTRVSHKDSKATGMSLESQHKMMLEYRLSQGLPAWARERGNRGAGKFEDAAVSAWRFDLDERPDGSKLVKALRPGDHVIFASMDRGFRSVENWARQHREWNENNVTLHFVRQGFNTKSAAGKLIGNVLASFAQFKSDMLTERMRMIRLANKYGKGPAQNLKEEYRLQGSNEFAQIAMALREMRARHLHKDPGTVYGYIRCSHIEQLELDNTLPAQQKVVEKYMSGLGLQMSPVLRDEAVSAWTTPFAQRPSGRILSDLVRAGDHVVFPRLDRAFRSVHDMVNTLKRWDELGVVAHFVDSGIRTDDREGRVLLGVLACLCEYESQLMSETIGEGLAVCGKLWNLPHWIKKANDRVIEWYVPDYESLEEMYQIREWWYDGKMTRWEMSDELERRRAEKLGCKPIPRSGFPGTRLLAGVRERFGVTDDLYDPRKKGHWRKWGEKVIDENLKMWQIADMEVAILEGETVDVQKVAELRELCAKGKYPPSMWGPPLRLWVENRRASRAGEVG